MRVVVAIGGSVLGPGEPDSVRGHADAIGEIVEAGHSVVVVVGGGSVARDYIAAGRALGANEIELDDIGIAVTRLNARLLAAALGDRAAPVPATTYEEARAALARDEVAVMGGTIGGHTTDAVSAATAEYVDADQLVYATSVPGVFSADPDADPAAERYEELTAGELVDVVTDLEVAAGSSAPVDLLAAKLIERSGLRTVVLDGTDPDRIVDAVLGGAPVGTAVVPGP